MRSRHAANQRRSRPSADPFKCGQLSALFTDAARTGRSDSRAKREAIGKLTNGRMAAPSQDRNRVVEAVAAQMIDCWRFAGRSPMPRRHQRKQKVTPAKTRLAALQYEPRQAALLDSLQPQIDELFKAFAG